MSWADNELCPFCGLRVETPCDEPPVDTCELALNTLAERDERERITRIALTRAGELHLT